MNDKFLFRVWDDATTAPSKIKRDMRTYVSSEGCKEILNVTPVPATSTRNDTACCEEDAMTVPLLWLPFFVGFVFLERVTDFFFTSSRPSCFFLFFFFLRWNYNFMESWWPLSKRGEREWGFSS